jgi:hypothetical protein
MTMRLFTCTDHDINYPVGGASIVLAGSEEEASLLLAKELKSRGLDPNDGFSLQEVPLDEARAIVLCDGEY